MKEQTTERISGLLVLVLLGVFAVCILIVLLTGAKSYARLAERDSTAFDRRTAAQYLATKIRQSDSENAVYIGNFDADSAQTEGDTLILREEAGENVYLTRIYCADGSLRELFGTADGGMQPEDGEIILAAESVHFTQNGRRITADITNADGETTSLVLTLRSGEEAAA